MATQTGQAAEPPGNQEAETSGKARTWNRRESKNWDQSGTSVAGNKNRELAPATRTGNRRKAGLGGIASGLQTSLDVRIYRVVRCLVTRSVPFRPTCPARRARLFDHRRGPHHRRGDRRGIPATDQGYALRPTPHPGWTDGSAGTVGGTTQSPTTATTTWVRPNNPRWPSSPPTPCLCAVCGYLSAARACDVASGGSYWAWRQCCCSPTG
jgi:hypothetical protein